MPELAIDGSHPPLHAVLYFGNGRGRGGVSDVFEMAWNPEKGCWENERFAARVFPDNRVECDKLPEEGLNFGAHYSANEADVRTFRAGCAAALTVALGLVEGKQEELHVVGCWREGEVYTVSDPASLRKEGDRYVSPDCDFALPGYCGTTTFKDGEGRTAAKLFSGFNLLDVELVRTGMRAALEVFCDEKEEEACRGGDGLRC